MTFFQIEANDRVDANLGKMATAANVRKAVLVQRLFDCGYSARCAPTGDAALDRAVSSPDLPKASPAPALAIDTASKADIDALRTKVAEVGKKAALVDDLERQLEATRKRAAKLTEENAALAKRDAGLLKSDAAESKRVTDAEAKARAALAEAERMKRALIDADARNVALTTRNGELKRAFADLEAQVVEVIKRQERAEQVGKLAMPEPEPDTRTHQQQADALSAAEVRSIKGLWSIDTAPAEIGRRAGISTDAVKIILKLSPKQGRASA